MPWRVRIDELGGQVWSVGGELVKHDEAAGVDVVDRAGSHVVGDEQAARAFALELFGDDAELVVNLLPPPA